MTRLKVIIIDDDVLAIEDFQTLIDWENSDFQIVGTAINGKRGIELVQKLHPDIALVDITMPIMDGLEFCQYINDAKIELKIILLTAYQDFHYAKTAISLGISNYILKHEIDGPMLLSELNKLKIEIFKCRQSHQMIQQQVVTRLIYSLYDAAEKKPPICSLDIMSKYPGMLLILFHTESPFKIYPSTLLKSTSAFELVRWLSQKNPPSVSNMSFQLNSVPINHSTVLTLLIFGKNMTGEDAMFRDAFSIASFLKSAYADENSQPLLTVLSPCFYSTNEISSYSARMLSMSAYGVFTDKKEVQILLDMEKQISHTDQNFDFSEMEAALSDSNTSKVLTLLFAMLDKSTTEGWNLQKLERICLECANIICRFAKKNHIEAYCNSCNIDSALCYSLDDIKAHFSDLVERLLLNNRECYSIKIRKALDYIHQHYQEDIMLEDVANYINISSIYLSKLFKTELKTNFTMYITQYRMEIAKRMLKKGEYKIYEVADHVGYHTSQYFSSLFRKIIGQNPSDYIKGRGENL